MRNKKAQFYIFTAILLIGYVMTMAPGAAKPKKPVPTFKNLYQNYMAEAPKVINNALFFDSNVSDSFMNFSDNFLAYAKTRDPNFRFVYALLYKDSIYVKNYLEETINATANTTTVGLSSNDYRDVAKAGTIKLNVSNLIYTLYFTEPTQLKAFFRIKKGKEVNIYVSG